jgi:exonuclease SbcD
MRILHAADIHLAPRLDWLTDPARRAERRRDVAAQVDRIPTLVGEHGVDAIVLAGDIFDRDLPGQLEVSRLKVALEEAAVPALIVPGTHDPWHPGGIWDRSWPANVHVFDGDDWRSLVVADAAFYGIACTGRPRSEPLFHGIPRIEGRYQIGIAHASMVRPDIREKVDRKKYPFEERELERAPFHYLALGDYHRMHIMTRGGVTAAYPGTPEGIALDDAETGSRHMLLVELTDPQGPPIITPLRTNAKEVLIEELDLEDLDHEHPQDSLEQIRRVLMTRGRADRLARIDLIGVVRHALALDEEELTEECRGGYFFLEVRDRTKLLPETPGELNTIRAAFEHRLAKRLVTATDEQQRDLIKRAQRLGIQALEGLL